MTPKQWKLLECLERHNGEGTIEVFLEFDREPEDDTPEAVEKAWNLTRFVVAGMVRTLVKKGLATNNDGYGITDRGRELLEKRRRRSLESAKTTMSRR